MTNKYGASGPWQLLIVQARAGKNNVMQNTQTNRLFFALLLTMLPICSWAIDEVAARKIAEKEAGCGSAQPCQTRARLDKDKWVMVVWFIHGYRQNGEPILKPGDWVGITINQDGQITEKVPGA